MVCLTRVYLKLRQTRDLNPLSQVKHARLSCFCKKLCLFAVGSGADDEPEKRVMNFLAVMDLNCGKIVTKDNCAVLTDMVIDELVKAKKYTVIDRANRDKILGEAGFQLTGCVDESCTVEAGRILGVGKIVVGKVSKLGQTYIVSLQLLNVETAAVEVSAKETCKKCEIDDLITTVSNTARKLMGQAPLPTGSTTISSGAKGSEMIRVPAGEFIMGSSGTQVEKAFQLCKKYFENCKQDWFNDEIPQHRVYLDAFSVDKYEVSNEKYAKCVSVGPCSPNNKYDGFTDPQQPVVGVDWNQALTYCSWAGKRLPTEAEWEKAARGTDGRTYPWGEGIDCTKANYRQCGHNKTKPVGSYPSGASPYGAMDMAGNVWEWTADWYDSNYYRNGSSKNPKGSPSGRNRVFRGGSWSNYPSYIRVSYRRGRRPNFQKNYVGFRCARD